MTEVDPNEIIRNPTNYEDMLLKYQAQERRDLDKAMTRSGAKDPAELPELAKAALIQRQQRGTAEERPLKDRSILTEPKSPEINALRERLDRETNELAKRILEYLRQFPTLVAKLQGRVKPQ